jgi:hypothetical protein
MGSTLGGSDEAGTAIVVGEIGANPVLGHVHDAGVQLVGDARISSD